MIGKSELKMNAVKQTQECNTRQIIIHKTISSKRIHKRDMALQRASGAVLLFKAILSAMISKDSTSAVILVPMAFAMLVSKKLLMNFRIN